MVVYLYNYCLLGGSKQLCLSYWPSKMMSLLLIVWGIQVCLAQLNRRVKPTWHHQFGLFGSQHWLVWLNGELTKNQQREFVFIYLITLIIRTCVKFNHVCNTCMSVLFVFVSPFHAPWNFNPLIFSGSWKWVLYLWYMPIVWTKQIDWCFILILI